MTCKNYENFGWCNGNSVSNWVSGEKFNYPSQNCCSCGKGKEIINILYIFQNTVGWDKFVPECSYQLKIAIIWIVLHQQNR